MGKKRSNITVAVRVRPLISKELKRKEESCIKVQENVITVCKI